MLARVFYVFGEQTSNPFGAKGNPAAVIELPTWPADQCLLYLAQKAAQPVTAFVVKQGERFHIRWFSLTTEINLCGHGSLAAGAMLADKYACQSILLTSDYGDIPVSKKSGSTFQMLMPAWQATPSLDDEMQSLDGVEAVLSTRDKILVMDSKERVISFVPNLPQIATMPDHHALIITAEDGDSGYVLRYFAPRIGIDEDKATGSAQSSLAPYWMKRLGKTQVSATQLSTQGGVFAVHYHSQTQINLITEVVEHKSLDIDFVMDDY